MRVFLLLFPALSFAASLTLSPPVIYDCSGGLGKATLEWSGATRPVRVAVGPSNVSMTGLSGTAGKAETGTWVGDGLEFRLINDLGAIEALAIAKVQCGASEVAGNGMVGSSYFPLEVGNTWTYRTDSRAFTSSYITWKVTNLFRFLGQVYAEVSVVSTESAIQILLLREDSRGVIWRLTGPPTDLKEEVYMDPQGVPRTPFSNALGSYPDSLSITRREPLLRDEQVFIRGVGLARSRATVIAGSSGGFSSSLELVEFQLATGPKVLTSMPRISVSAEATRLDVTGRKVTDCFVPCYFAACGLTPGSDPPGTYKPCARTRIEASASGTFWADLALLNGSGQVVFQAPRATLPAGEAVRYVQVPLYSEPNRPLPAGTYRLVGRMGAGETEAASSAIMIEIQ